MSLSSIVADVVAAGDVTFIPQDRRGWMKRLLTVGKFRKIDYDLKK